MEVLNDNNMNTKEEAPNANGLRVEKEWHENGQLKKMTTYKGYMKDGECKEWYSNGQLSTSKNYKNGKKDGVQEIINIIDRRITRTFYKDGKLQPQGTL